VSFAEDTPIPLHITPRLADDPGTTSDEVVADRSASTANGAIGRVSLVIPTKNEAANIAFVLEQVPSCVDEIILVDAHSVDATLVTARFYRSDLRVISQPGTGKGDALRAGFLAATGDVIVMIDADGSMSPQEIPRLLFFLANGYDFVKGSRFVGGGASLDITPLRRLGNHGLVFLMNRLYNTHLTDLCYGFCAFHRRYLSFLDLSTPGFEIETQMTICAVRAGLRVAEVPSLEMPRRAGRSNLHTFRDGARVLRTLLRHHETGLSGYAVQRVRQAIHSKEGAADGPGLSADLSVTAAGYLRGEIGPPGA
jgi:glycosyltransferase involved in cell wall biosynthesis